MTLYSSVHLDIKHVAVLTIWSCNVMTYRCDTTLLIKQVILMLQTHAENNALLHQAGEK